MDLYIIGLIILAALAISDLVVGVSNDAANFMNSSIGSRVASRKVIMIICSLGMLAGVLFSKGMMEVARKGIFHPQNFTMPDLMIIFLVVMLTNVLLLDLYNTFGLPTSTTVSIVFALLGAAVAVSLIKISEKTDGIAELSKYINTGKALLIIAGILLSVVVAFLCGAVVQFFSRLLFTFDFVSKFKKFGALWGGMALTSICYFILIKGAKGSTFITQDTLLWIKSNTPLLLLLIFVGFSIILQIVLMVSQINILKPIVLVGTFALAMAFAANDLVNFIGVPLAGLNAYKVAQTLPDPLNGTMSALAGQTPSDTLLLLFAGIIMVVTLWNSRKAKTVSSTEVNLSRQEEGVERFGSSPVSRFVVRLFTSMGDGTRKLLPKAAIQGVNRRFDPGNASKVQTYDGEKSSFDLLRASVNLMVASVIISLATSMKLPLSTTYVTFMVSMGSSFADRAWGRDSAVFRVTGVITVIGGWFMTAFMAFSFSALFAYTIYYLRAWGVILILSVGMLFLLRNRRLHKSREKEVSEYEIFNLSKVDDGRYAVATTFEHSSIFLKEVAEVIEMGFEGLLNSDRYKIRLGRRNAKKLRGWANVIVANIFKTLRLIQKEDYQYTEKYVNSIEALQVIAEAQRDIIRRASHHVNNHHKPMLPVQMEELNELKELLIAMMLRASNAMANKNVKDFKRIIGEELHLKELAKTYDRLQVLRIQDDSSKTRHSILYYGLARALIHMGENVTELMRLYEESFHISRAEINN